MKVQTVKLMGEANTLSEEHLQRVLGIFHNDLRELMASCNVPAERIFNADQNIVNGVGGAMRFIVGHGQ